MMTAQPDHIDAMLGGPIVEPTEEEIVAAETTEEVTTESSAEIQTGTSAEAHAESKPTPEESYKAMAHEERQIRRELQNKVDLMNRRFEQMMATLQQSAPKTPEPTEIDYDEDPMGATHAKVERALHAVEDIKKDSEAKRQQDEWKSFVHTVSADEATFKAKTPDYGHAVQFLQGRRASELQAMGYGEQEILQAFAADAYAITQRAQQTGQSPAQFLYDMARKVGYTPAAQSKNPVQSLEQMAAGQAVTIPSGSGGIPAGDSVASLEDLASMSDAEFEKLFNKMQPKH